jgi:DNA-binding MarR family transcriptional regulator
MIRRRNALLEAIEVFRDRSLDVCVNEVVAFLYVCENEGVGVNELARICRLSNPTASRSVRGLAGGEAAGGLSSSMGLVWYARDPNDGRGKLIFLTEAGRRLRDELDEIIDEGVPIVIPGAQLAPRAAPSVPGERTPKAGSSTSPA